VRNRRFLPGMVLAVLVTGSVALMVSKSRGLWFFGDDFAFLLRRGVGGDAELGVLAPHNEHWVTIPVVLYRVLFSFFGMHHYLPYALLPILAHAAACVTLFLLLRRCLVETWAALVAVAVFAFFGGGSANLLWDFQITFVGSAVFGLLALHSAASAEPSRRTTVRVWVFATAALMCSGMGIAMLLWLGLFVLLRRGLLAAAAATVLPGVLLLVWHWTAGSVATQAPATEITHIPIFVWNGLGYVWHVATGIPAVGAVVWLALVAIALWGRAAPAHRALSVAGMVSAVVAYVLIATSRGFLGDGAGMEGRYAYFGLLFSLPAFAAAVEGIASAMGERARVKATAWFVAVAFFITTGWHTTSDVAHLAHLLTAGAAERVVAASDLASGDQLVLNDVVDLPYNPDIDARRLDDPSIREALPDLRPTAATRFNAAAHMLVDAASGRLPLGGPESVRWGGVLGERREHDGCRAGLARPGAWLAVSVGDRGGQIRLRAAGDTILTVLEKDGRRSSPVSWPLEDGPTYVGTSLPGATVIVVLAPGPMSYCVG
jgi:hypothetical protein